MRTILVAVVILNACLVNGAFLRKAASKAHHGGHHHHASKAHHGGHHHHKHLPKLANGDKDMVAPLADAKGVPADMEQHHHHHHKHHKHHKKGESLLEAQHTLPFVEYLAWPWKAKHDAKHHPKKHHDHKHHGNKHHLNKHDHKKHHAHEKVKMV